LAELLKERHSGDLPSNTEANPKGYVKAITTRSGKTTSPVKPLTEPVAEECVDEEVQMESSGEVHQWLGPASTAQPENSPKKKNVTEEQEVDMRFRRVPYPARLLQQKYGKEYEKFLELFTQLKVNLPFVEALQHMPKYAKFLKDLLTNKKKLKDVSSVILNENCSAVVQNKLPEKMSGPGSFTIPCLFGSSADHCALADLGASINLMPYSVFTKLGLGELTPTRMSILLADKSMKNPRGVVQNFLVRIEKFVFPVDFVVLDMEEDEKATLILGRPFLNTARALLDVFDGKITLRVEEESVTFNVPMSNKNSSNSHDPVFVVNTSTSRSNSHRDRTGTNGEKPVLLNPP
jgi:hypothetical protein